MGTGIVILITAFLVYFVAGGSVGKLIIFSFIGFVLGIFLIISSEYRLNRVKTFFNPSQDPLGTSYHMRQILMALGSGGLSGVGLGQSKQKYQYLPESTGDSIFAVIAEETGFLGSTVLISLFLLLIYVGLKNSRKMPRINLAVFWPAGLYVGLECRHLLILRQWFLCCRLRAFPYRWFPMEAHP